MRPVDPSRSRPSVEVGAIAEFAALVRGQQRPVWRYLRLLGADPHEADDLMQDAFVVASERLLAGERLVDVGAYLRGTARNLLLSARRKARRRPPTVPWLEEVDERLRDDPAALDDERLERLRGCVERLSGRMQDAVRWHHVDGASCADVAARLGIGANGIKSLLSRARAALRACVQQPGEGERP
ncbi:MAG: RNA polymerase sigma factor [Planctomycetota bacterium]